MNSEIYNATAASIQHYTPLIGAIAPPYNMRIKNIFVGVDDEILSKDIYLGLIGQLPEIPISTYEHEHLELWVGLANNFIYRISHLMQFPNMARLCEAGALEVDLEVNENWSEPISVPLGKNVKVTFLEPGLILFKMTDNNKPNKIIEWEKEGYQSDHYYFILDGDDRYGLNEMSDPHLSVKLPENLYRPLNILLQFVNHI